MYLTATRGFSRGEALPDDCARAGIQGNASSLPCPPVPNGTAPGSLAAIVQNFKSITSRKINQARQMPAAPVRQRNYYEHVI
jgi:hypothetical protein